jgi:1-phosphatidylinositol-3-phosphate 5-kinase
MPDALDRKDIKRVYHDNNFIYEMGARPLAMRYNMNKILNICVNNDTLCLTKAQIIDYSLLVIINTRTKRLRFAIIDYVQHYTLEKMLETRFKKFWKGNEPTIIEPEKYKKRFKKAIKKYFVAMCI